MELGPDHLVVAKALNNLAVIYSMQVCQKRCAYLHTQHIFNNYIYNITLKC